ncbi:MAG TPA: hypothetical protein VLU92_02585 [Candidatus Dormibacteraeota bacterium]|nr:hypothetical protein [Candidatus Dormibacteraeota bacterium]
MPIALIAGPVVALIGVVAVFFVLRRKSVDKRSMYSARRSQIEHKVRAARQRTLTPHGHADKPSEAADAAPPFAVAPGSQATSYAPAAYEPPPAAPAPPFGAPPAPPFGAPEAPPFGAPEAPPSDSPWGPVPPGSSPFGTTTAAPPPLEPAPEPFLTPPEPPAYQPPEPPAYQPPEPPAFQPPAGEPAWTPAAAPSAPATPIEQAQPSVMTPAGGGASWSIVGDTKDMSGGAEPEPSRKGRGPGPSGSWQLASGEAPGSEADEVIKTPSPAVAIAQYAILVVGLVMVLIGVLVMIANSHAG